MSVTIGPQVRTKYWWTWSWISKTWKNAQTASWRSIGFVGFTSGLLFWANPQGFVFPVWKIKMKKKNAQGDSFLPSIKGHSTILLNCFYFSVNYSVDSYGCVLYVAAPLFLFCFSSQHVKSFWIIRRCASSSSDADNSQIAFGVKMT